MQKLGSAQNKLATWICPFCVSVHHVVTACGWGKVTGSEKRLGCLSCLALKLEGALWMTKRSRMKRKEHFFIFPCKIVFFLSSFCHKRRVQFQTSHLNQMFDTWLELLSSSLSLCSARASQNRSCIFTIWLSCPECGSDTARTFRPLLIACSHRFPCATTGFGLGNRSGTSLTE